MRKVLFLLALAAILAAAAVPALAQELSARLVGFERADAVTGTVILLADKSVVLRGFDTVYDRSFQLILAKGLSLAGGVSVGEVPAGFSGDMTFSAPTGGPDSPDSVLLVPLDLPAPVALGLFR